MWLFIHWNLVVIQKRRKIVELKIQFIKQLNFSDLLNYTQLKNYTPDFWKPLNILMRWLRLWDPKL